MAAYYGTKIIKGETNNSTGQPWKVDDVPKLWRAKTRKWVDEHMEG